MILSLRNHKKTSEFSIQAALVPLVHFNIEKGFSALYILTSHPDDLPP
jgi:hypothetical protein